MGDFCVSASLTISTTRASVLSVAFVVSRTLYIGAYLADQDYLRSAIWGIGFVCTLALFGLPWL